jgi:uncharacterized protein (DUF2236 family)
MLLRPLDRLAAGLMMSDSVDFTQPAGEPGMVPADSISWRVFGNPVTMYIGGIAAVLLELGEPRVRHGVWDHSSFQRDPGTRLRRTGMAAMVTVFGARSQFEALAERVNRMHAKVRGETPDGTAYVATDPALLLWVQVTAGWAFLQAYSDYAARVTPAERDRYFAEGRAGAALYGVETPPASDAEVRAIFADMLPSLEPSPIIEELIAILRTAPILPAALRPVQRLGVRAAIDLLPVEFRRQLGLDQHRRLTSPERRLLRGLARLSDRIELPSSPAAQARRRLGIAAKPRGGRASRVAPA